MADRRAIGYIRVSSVGGRSGPEYHTLDIQRASIERTAARNGHQIIDILTDEDQSGKTRDRPQFKIAMERVLAGDAEAIIVWKVSRFSRSWRQAAEDVETLLDNGKDLLSEEGFDTATAGGRLLLRILFSMANWEHDVLGEHWEIIKAKAVRDRGSHLGNAPIGYTTGRGGVLQPDPETRGLVLELFTMRANGASWARIADRLDAERPRPTGRRDRKDVERIITSRVYLGETRWRDQVNDHAHTPIIEPGLWQQANATINDQPRQTNRSPARTFPLSGWLRCCGCGGPMGGSMDRGRKGPVPNYKCSRRRGGCEHPQTISAVAAEAWALAQAEQAHAGLRVGAIAVEKVDPDVLRRRGEVEAALHELASVDARRALGDDWLPMMRRLRAEKEAIEKAEPRRAPEDAKSWDDLDDAERFGRLRSIAHHGALVGPAIGRGRHGRPADRLSLIEDTEGDAIPSGEVLT